jgi:phosphoglycerol transferase MdoB-like AlkP superfamily enzyme
MRKRILLFTALTGFWMLYFVVARTVFLLYNTEFTAHLTWGEILKSSIYGLKMDMSMTGYFILMYGLLFTLSVFYFSKAISCIIHSITILFLLTSVLIVTIDLELYHHWGFRMNITPLFYMGEEATGTVDHLILLKLISISIFLLILFSWIYFKLIAPKINKLTTSHWRTSLVTLLIMVVVIIPIRGSFGASTMNPSMVYYHPTNTFANHVGINVVWNFLYSLNNDNAIKYPENFFDKQLTEKLFNELYPPSTETYKVVNQSKPNILLIILEGITTEVIEPLGGRPGIMPNLNALCHEGILFDRFYSNGDRTDKGLVSILSSFPAQPRGSIIKYPQKTQRLSFLSAKLEKLGYTSSFVYGGDVDFANYRSFLTNGRFQHITSIDDFSEVSSSQWGIPDEYVFNKALQEMDTTKTQPFFKVVLTVSSHEPFDVPMETVIQGKDEPSKYMNSCYYTDKSLGEFITKAKQSDWWANTLVVITADHGHRLPGRKKQESHERYHIPMLWLGGAIEQDTVVHTMGNQSDIANTLLAQLDTVATDLTFSKNLFGNNTRDFAMYIFVEGYGFIDNTRYIIYDIPGKQYLIKEGIEQQEELNMARAYLQKLYTDYNAKK